MSQSVLSKYLDPAVLNQLADRQFDPRGLVLGNLAGSHKSPLSGFAVEFASHREYVVGDDPKHLDWRLYYRRERLFVKQYELETNLVCHLLVDVSASMRYGEGAELKWQYASQLAATLAYCVVRQNDKVSLTLFDNVLRGHVPPGNSMSQIVRLTSQLGDAVPEHASDIGQCLTEAVARFGRREIVVVFTDALTDLKTLEDGLQRLRYQKHEVVLMHVLHSHERTFEFEGMVKFLGLEDQSETLADSLEIRAGYLAELERFTAELSEICGRNRVELVPIDTSRPIGEVLTDYLNHRQRLQLAR